MWDRLVRWRWWLGGAALVLVGAIVAVVLWASPSPSPAAPYRPPARERIYNTFTVCLLTGPQGIFGATAAPVWSGVQKAANAANDQAEYLAATTPVETVGSVTPYVNTLILQQCGVVIAVGSVEIEAMGTVAPQYAKVRFIAVGGGTAAANVQVVPEPSTSAVAAAVGTAIQAG